MHALPSHCFRERCIPKEEVDTILIHSCSVVHLNKEDPFNINRLKQLFVDLGVSAHYVIDREGRIHPLVAPEKCAFHAGKGSVPWQPKRTNNLNDYSIGIELLAIGTYEEMSDFLSQEEYSELTIKAGYTQAQYKSLNTLIEQLREAFPKISNTRKHIFGHDEYAPDRKTDPGSLFNWAKINVLG